MALILPPLPANHVPHDFLHQVPQRQIPMMDQSKSSRPSLPSISRLIDDINSANARPDQGSSISPKSDTKVQANCASPNQDGAHFDQRPNDRPRNQASSAPSPEIPQFQQYSRQDPSLSPARQPVYPPPPTTNPELYTQRTSSYPPVPDQSQYPPLESNHWQGSLQGRPPAQPVTSLPLAPAEPQRENGRPPSLAQQKPLPPFSLQMPIDPQMAPPPNAWHSHHHYFPNLPNYPQTQERYTCPTCSKPFSRPSSLKIHTYSHTGEKPYKCKHEGCGKHFSVRSNMKRHEKGCHGGDGASTNGSSPKTS